MFLMSKEYGYSYGYKPFWLKRLINESSLADCLPGLRFLRRSMAAQGFAFASTKAKRSNLIGKEIKILPEMAAEAASQTSGGIVRGSSETITIDDMLVGTTDIQVPVIRYPNRSAESIKSLMSIIHTYNANEALQILLLVQIYFDQDTSLPAQLGIQVDVIEKGPDELAAEILMRYIHSAIAES